VNIAEKLEIRCGVVTGNEAKTDWRIQI